MSGDECRALLIRLEFADPARPGDQGVSEAARFFHYSRRPANAWSTEGPPAPVAIALRLMAAAGWTLKEARERLRRMMR